MVDCMAPSEWDMVYANIDIIGEEGEHFLCLSGGGLPESTRYNVAMPQTRLSSTYTQTI
jgi:hypothetical protein